MKNEFKSQLETLYIAENFKTMSQQELYTWVASLIFERDFICAYSL